MKICLAGTFNHQDTGPSRVVEGLSRGLARLNHEVIILGHGDRTEHSHENVTVVHLGETPESMGGFYRLFRTMQEELEVLEYDVFHPLEEYPGGSAVRTVQWTMDSYERLKRCRTDFRGFRFFAGELLVNLAGVVGARRTDYLVASSPETERQMSRYWQTPPQEVIPLGIDEESLVEPERRDGPSRVLLVGRITPKKGQKRVLDHFDRDADYRVDIVGGVADEEYYETISAWHDRHHGFISREELNEYYQNADVVVVPSYHENFSLVAHEAIARGCVVVITGACGFAKFVWATPENGIHVVSNGAEAAAKVTELTQQDLYNQRLAAYELAQTMVWDEIAREYDELYRRLDVKVR